MLNDHNPPHITGIIFSFVLDVLRSLVYFHVFDCIPDLAHNPHTGQEAYNFAPVFILMGVYVYQVQSTLALPDIWQKQN